MVQTASAGHQKRAGATGSSRGARVRRATRPWRTAVLGNVAGVLRHGNEQNEALGMLYWVLCTCWTRRGDHLVTLACLTRSPHRVAPR